VPETDEDAQNADDDEQTSDDDEYRRRQHDAAPLAPVVCPRHAAVPPPSGLTHQLVAAELTDAAATQARRTVHPR